MFKQFVSALLLCGLASGTESFEKMGKGALTSGEVEYGQLSADAGHAEIHGKARSGEMIVRASRDDGQTWNEGIMYDKRRCMGYSCIAMTDPDHVGIIYETCHTNGKTGARGIGFIRIPIETIVTGKEVSEPAADDNKVKKSGKTKKGSKKKKKKKSAA